MTMAKLEVHGLNKTEETTVSMVINMSGCYRIYTYCQYNKAFTNKMKGAQLFQSYHGYVAL